MSNHDFLFFLILGVIVLAAVIVPMKRQKENDASYQECKAQTTDLEWCFAKFQPKLK